MNSFNWAPFYSLMYQIFKGYKRRICGKAMKGKQFGFDNFFPFNENPYGFNLSKVWISHSFSTQFHVIHVSLSHCHEITFTWKYILTKNTKYQYSTTPFSDINFNKEKFFEKLEVTSFILFMTFLSKKEILYYNFVFHQCQCSYLVIVLCNTMEKDK